MTTTTTLASTITTTSDIAAASANAEAAFAAFHAAREAAWAAGAPQGSLAWEEISRLLGEAKRLQAEADKLMVEKVGGATRPSTYWAKRPHEGFHSPRSPGDTVREWTGPRSMTRGPGEFVWLVETTRVVETRTAAGELLLSRVITTRHYEGVGDTCGYCGFQGPREGWDCGYCGGN